MTGPTNFEERLLEALKPHVGSVPRRTRVPAPRLPAGRPPVRRRTGILVGAGVLAAAAVVSGAVLWPRSAATPPAYAVEPQGDLLRVTLNDTAGDSGLQRELQADGVRAVVLPASPDGACVRTESALPEAPGMVRADPARLNQLVIAPTRIPAGTYLVLAWTRNGGQLTLVSGLVSGAAAPTCWSPPVQTVPIPS